MNAFVERRRTSVVGMLQGFDRLRLRGTVQPLAYLGGMMGYFPAVSGWSVLILALLFPSAWSVILTRRKPRIDH